MRKMNWDGNIYSEEAKRAQKLSEPGASSAQSGQSASPADRKRKIEGGMWPQPAQPHDESPKRDKGARAQDRPDAQRRPVQPSASKMAHTVIRTGGNAQPASQKQAGASPSPQMPPKAPVKKPEHVVVRTGGHAKAQPDEQKEAQIDSLPLPPSVIGGGEQQKIPQPRCDAGVPVSMDIRSYKRSRSGRTFGGDELFSPVNVIGALITIAALVMVGLNWQTVTVTLANGVLYVIVNLGGLLMLLVGGIALFSIIRGRRGRGGLFRGLFR